MSLQIMREVLFQAQKKNEGETEDEAEGEVGKENGKGKV